ncbi:hypothetical protein NKI20_29415 [Mesorhizobium sp. M0830]|uniref:hypothetical protein n=1 Tax=Mesorhizobium sp. M0830 TaxID=2957008 RepID=UPI00333D4CD3
MPIVQMLCDDIICRSILYPKSFPNDVFDAETLVKLDEIDGGSYAISVASRFLLGSDDAAHKYGCRAAVASNTRFASRNGRLPEPDKEQVYYLGFYNLRAGAVQDVKLDCYLLGIKWKPENDEDAHFEIQLSAPGAGHSKKELKEDRKLARQLIALCLMGAHRHVCTIDESRSAALDAIQLPDLAEQAA